MKNLIFCVIDKNYCVKMSVKNNISLRMIVQKYYLWQKNFQSESAGR